MVQAPALEALEMVGPSRQPEHVGPTAAQRRPAAPPTAHRRPSPPLRPRPRPHPDHPRRSTGDLPGLSQPVPRAPDVCALGKKYGGWRGDSPEAEICEQTYGR
ncbi:MULTISPECIES: hypothetical protein [Streptomyces]|uniref:hypothetical protein n=1 Tax=Streptomyces TaxID=1883 RepID=UPI0026C97FAB|nr:MULTISPECIES: hypothetical protein [Streptomyces]